VTPQLSNLLVGRRELQRSRSVTCTSFIHRVAVAAAAAERHALHYVCRRCTRAVLGKTEKKTECDESWTCSRLTESVPTNRRVNGGCGSGRRQSLVPLLRHRSRQWLSDSPERRPSSRMQSVSRSVGQSTGQSRSETLCLRDGRRRGERYCTVHASTTALGSGFFQPIVPMAYCLSLPCPLAPFICM
jgi:hypothetical protein